MIFIIKRVRAINSKSRSTIFLTLPTYSPLLYPTTTLHVILTRLVLVEHFKTMSEDVTLTDKSKYAC